MFYIIYNKVCIESCSAQSNTMKHCTEPHQSTRVIRNQLISGLFKMSARFYKAIDSVFVNGLFLHFRVRREGHVIGDLLFFVKNKKG